MSQSQITAEYNKEPSIGPNLHYQLIPANEKVDSKQKEDIVEDDGNARKRVIVPEITSLPDNVKALIGRNLEYKDIDSIMPTLADFRDPETTETVNHSIAKNERIIFSSVKMLVTEFADRPDDADDKWNKRFRFLWHGRAVDGRVILLIINDAFPSMYVRCPDGMDEEHFVRMIRSDISILKIIPARELLVVQRKRFVGYEDTTRPYVKVEFTYIKDYYNAKKHFAEIKRLDVANVDFPKKRLYLQITREADVNPAGMNCFKYKSRGNPYPKSIVSDIDEIFVVSINDIHAWRPESDEKRESFWIPRLSHINFDIETGSKVRGQALYAERDDTHSHVVSFTQRYNRKDQLRVSLTTSEFAEPRVGYIQIICPSEILMFLGLAKIWRRLRPAIISTYNGDNFDWRFIVTKLRKAGVVSAFFSDLDFLIVDQRWRAAKGLPLAKIEQDILGSYMVDTVIKISAEDSQCPIYYPEVIGFLNIDIFTKCKQLWPGSKFSQKSLNAFLAKLNIPAKYDMPTWRQFDIYEAKLEVDNEKRALKDSSVERKYFSSDGSYTDEMLQHIEDITNVNVYCVFDTISALDLCDAAGIITNMLIVGEEYMCTQNEAIYLAKGGLVMDKVVYSAFHAGYLDGSSEREKKNGYPGAFVIHPPIRGLTTITPRVSDRMATNKNWNVVTSLEAKLMIAAMTSDWKNPMSTEAFTQLTDVARALFREMWNEHKSVPVVDFDFASMYPTLMAEHCSSPERIVETVEDEEKLVADGHRLYVKTRQFNGRTIHTALVQTPPKLVNGKLVATGPNERGVIPSVQHALKIKRKMKQKELENTQNKLRELKANNKNAWFPVEEAMCDRLNAEQLECKISMNTMYGKMGDPTNKFFRICISSDVTLSGREYLEEVIRFLESQGWPRIRYGDTDSVYVEPPSDLFDDFHFLFFTEQITREEYAYKMTECAIKLGKQMAKKINDHLRTGREGFPPSDFMSMEFEGAHFPAIFIRQKRNVTRFHGENTKFEADFSEVVLDGSEKMLKSKRKQFHITGIGWKKDKASSKLFIELSSEMIFRLLDINNAKSAAEIARDVIKDAFTKASEYKYPMEYFIERATYKPEKNNVCVINFFNRLKKMGRIPPQAYEKFEYVKIRRDDIEFNESGCINHTTAADYMELFSYAVENKLPIHFSKYMLGSVCNEIAQYMCCEPNLIVHAKSNDIGSLVLAEEETKKQGEKFIETLCRECAGVMPTSVKKPVYMGIKTHAAAFLKSLAPSIANVTRAADLHILAHSRENGTINAYLKNIEPIAAMAAIPLAETFKTSYCRLKTESGEPTPIDVIIRTRSRMTDVINSPKVAYCNLMRPKKEAILAELDAECKKIDEFAAWHAKLMNRISDVIKERLGLTKSIISNEDISNAAIALKSNKIVESLDIKIDDTSKIPSREVFERCDFLVNELASIEKMNIAFDLFSDYLGSIIASRTGGSGINLNSRTVKIVINESSSGFETDDSAFEMPTSRGD